MGRLLVENFPPRSRWSRDTWKPSKVAPKSVQHTIWSTNLNSLLVLAQLLPPLSLAYANTTITILEHHQELVVDRPSQPTTSGGPFEPTSQESRALGCSMIDCIIVGELSSASSASVRGAGSSSASAARMPFIIFHPSSALIDRLARARSSFKALFEARLRASQVAKSSRDLSPPS